jgi:hypothetical protein
MLSGRTRCPLNFFEAHAACFPFNPFSYASIKRQERAENLASMSDLSDILILDNITFACFLKGQIQVPREHFVQDQLPSKRPDSDDRCASQSPSIAQ